LNALTTQQRASVSCDGRERRALEPFLPCRTGYGMRGDRRPDRKKRAAED